MKSSASFRFSPGVIGYPLLLVGFIWMVFWFEVRFDIRLNHWGVHPRSLLGIRGILFGPFIHSSLEHLYQNTLPLIVLSTALFYFYRTVAWRVLGLGLLFSGLGTWLLGTSGYHIGASGVIYVLMSFILFKGIFSTYFRLIALSLTVVFLYGGMLWYVFPVKEQMSWEGHLSGLIVGFVLALVFKTPNFNVSHYIWEDPNYNEDDDPFLKHFDQDGNFIETSYDDPKEDSL